MRVKVANQWHDSDEEPVAIQVSTVEQQQIGSMDRTQAPNGRYAVFPDAWSANQEAMRDWVRGEGEQPPSLQRKLDEAHALLIWMMGILPEELEPPLLKEMGDVLHARQMGRKMLEEKYALARMTARMSLHKAHQLESERDALANRVDFLNRQNSAQAEQMDEMEDQVSQMSARVVEGDVERDKLAVRAREVEEELQHVQGQRDAAILRAQRAEDGQHTAQDCDHPCHSEQHITQDCKHPHHSEQHAAHSTGAAS
ncbi:hypothetical protein FIU88_05620 [Halomonas sp. THAF12]|uniref:hypothetical protein n=1 Tax=Halomonas sp. THAF12 TaxID=2587849 RepID=UPI00126931D9|nr:hypothetical protein [Halomonas sp. THAF12]QFT84457.1 hypothetical protein FIU88_05620 [Halomonas sp. THAF12]